MRTPLIFSPDNYFGTEGVLVLRARYHMNFRSHQKLSKTCVCACHTSTQSPSVGGRAAKVLEKDFTTQAVSIAFSRTIHVYVSLEEAHENTYIYTVSLRNARCLERTSKSCHCSVESCASQRTTLQGFLALFGTTFRSFRALATKNWVVSF